MQNKFIVNEKTELLNFLLSKMINKSRKSVKSLLLHKKITVNGKTITKYDYSLKKNDIVNADYNKKQDSVKGIKILHEDRYIIVIEKKEGLLSVSGEDKSRITAGKILNEYLKKEKSRVFPVHRLDQDTSGVMMFAKNRDIQHTLRDNWDKLIVKRLYIALIEGHVSKKQGTVISWLKEDKNFKMISSSKEGDGKKAITYYKTLNENKDYALLEVELHTGRKNQIRVHMKDLGHCVIGDRKYGALSDPIRRLGLHAHILSFKHPVTEQTMNFVSEMPGSFNVLIKA